MGKDLALITFAASLLFVAGQPLTFEPLSPLGIFFTILLGIFLGALVRMVTGFKTREEITLSNGILDTGAAACYSLALTPGSLGIAYQLSGWGLFNPKFFWTWPAVMSTAFVWMLIGMNFNSVIMYFLGRYSGKNGGSKQ